VLVAVLAVCSVGYALGSRRYGERIFYFYELGDVGHPGIVNVVGAFGLLATAVVSIVFALSSRHVAWLVSAVLFVVLAADDLLRVHNNVPGGDVAARLLYWAVLAYLVVQLRPVVHDGFLRALLLTGVLAFVTSEALDIVSSTQYGRGAVLEESAGVLGAWCIALAIVGLADQAMRDGIDVLVPPVRGE
jgi:hypothetical protein